MAGPAHTWTKVASSRALEVPSSSAYGYSEGVPNDTIGIIFSRNGQEFQDNESITNNGMRLLRFVAAPARVTNVSGGSKVDIKDLTPTDNNAHVLHVVSKKELDEIERLIGSNLTISSAKDGALLDTDKLAKNSVAIDAIRDINPAVGNLFRLVLDFAKTKPDFADNYDTSAKAVSLLTRENVEGDVADGAAVNFIKRGEEDIEAIGAALKHWILGGKEGSALKTKKVENQNERARTRRLASVKAILAYQKCLGAVVTDYKKMLDSFLTGEFLHLYGDSAIDVTCAPRVE